MNEMEIAFNKFYEENTFLHGYSKSVLFHSYKNGWNKKEELSLADKINDLDKHREDLSTTKEILIDAISYLEDDETPRSGAV